MTKRHTDLQAYIGREIDTKPVRKIALYTGLFLLNLLLVGYFGLYKGYTSFVKKRAFYQSAQQTASQLKTNIAIVDEIEPYVLDNQGVKFIDFAIPDKGDFSSYVRDVSLLAASHGFTVESMSYSGFQVGDPRLSVSFVARGPSENIVRLIRDLEEIDRLTTVTDISVRPKSTRDPTMSLNMSLTIYKGE